MIAVNRPVRSKRAAVAFLLMALVLACEDSPSGGAVADSAGRPASQEADAGPADMGASESWQGGPDAEPPLAADGTGDPFPDGVLPSDSAAVCEPESLSCAGGADVVKCNAAGSEWAYFKTCPTGQKCAGAGECVCAPACGGKQCGPDGCGGFCGKCVDWCTGVEDAAYLCTPDGHCMSACCPSCNGKQCGPDGCAGNCGECPTGTACNTSGECVCAPDCSGKQCGDDGCGGSCGACAGGAACNQSGQCVFNNTGCEQIQACVDACADDACKQACVAAGGPAEVAKFQALADCLAASCAAAVSEAEAHVCGLVNCPCEISQCDGCVESCEGFNYGAKTCNDTFKCVDNACGNIEDVCCPFDCMLDAGKDALAKFAEMSTCFQTNCDGNPDPAGCAMAKCMGEVMACLTN